MTAVVHSTTRLRCDAPGCKAKWPKDKTFPSGHDYTRKQAALDGWTNHGWSGGDRCPDHSAALIEEEK